MIFMVDSCNLYIFNLYLYDYKLENYCHLLFPAIWTFIIVEYNDRIKFIFQN